MGEETAKAKDLEAQAKKKRAQASAKFEEYKAAFAADKADRKASAEKGKSIQDKYFAEYKRLMREYRTMHNGASPTLNAAYTRIFEEYEAGRKPSHAQMVLKKERKRKLYRESRTLMSDTPTEAMFTARRNKIKEADAIHPYEDYKKANAELKVIKNAAEAKAKATYDATIKRALNKAKQADQALASFRAAGGTTK